MSDQTLSEMIDELTQSQQAFLTLLDQVDEEQLYQKSDDEWTPAMTLVHIAEARQFFAAEVQKVLASPDTAVGRTIQDPHRLQTIETHGSDSLNQIREQLVTGHKAVLETLSKITDDDLSLTVKHVKGDVYTLPQFLQRFLVGHDNTHVQQVTALLQQ